MGSEAHAAPGAGAGSGVGLDQTCCCTDSFFDVAGALSIAAPGLQAPAVVFAASDGARALPAAASRGPGIPLHATLRATKAHPVRGGVRAPPRPARLGGRTPFELRSRPQFPDGHPPYPGAQTQPAP